MKSNEAMKLIDKDALVVEIEKLIDEIYAGHPFDSLSSKQQTALWYVKSIMSSIDTLGVKEVDLEKEVESYWKQSDLTWCRDAYSMTHIRSMLSDVAKHFFELGTRVNNPITSADRGIAEEIIINLKRVEQDYQIDLTKEMEWLRNKVKKAG